MRHLLLAVLLAFPLAALSVEHAGVWTHSDDRGTLSISLSADGHCEVAAFEAKTRQSRTARCRYSVHGSRIRLRTNTERDGEAFNSLDIEHVRDSNSLVVHGDRPRIMRRYVDHWRQD